MERQLAQVMLGVASGEKWEVIETTASGARVWPERGVAGLPLDDSPHAVYVRLHEIAHTTLSPKGGAKDSAAAAAEDARLLGILLGPTTPASLREIFLAGYSRFLPASHVPTLHAAVGMLGHRDANMDRLWIKTRFPQLWQELLLLGSLLPPGIWHPETGWRRVKPRLHDAALLAEGLRMFALPLEKIQTQRKSGSLQWARLEIKERRPRGRSRLTEEGLILEAPLNVLTQSPCFRRQQVRAGTSSTVLVDGSVSMMWKSLEEIRARLPRGARWALYGGTAEQRCGQLVVEPEWLTCWPDNLVDGPVLEWLGRQPGRRYWLSDGEVTGITPEGRSGTSPLLHMEARALCARHGITRISR